MKCRTANKNFSALLDATLTPAVADVVRDHLRSCDACAAAWEASRRARSSVTWAPGPRCGWQTLRPNTIYKEGGSFDGCASHGQCYLCSCRRCWSWA